jgi:osmoprotectant transport system permease protein
VLPLVLLLAGGLAFWPGFLAVAPNRLTGGVPVPLLQCAPFWGMAIGVALAVLASCAFLARRAVALGAGSALIWLVPLAAGAGSRALAAHAAHAARIELAAGFWLLLAVGVLAMLDASLALPSRPWPRIGFAIGLGAGLALAGRFGCFDALSLAREFTNHRAAFMAASARHLLLVAITLAGAILLGVPLGIAVWRKTAWRAPVFSVLNVIQTLPSIALFGLLMTPLARLGLSGIGLVPACIALVLYALLPTVRATVSGLDGVPQAPLLAASGLGMRGQQIFFQLHLPMAAPALLAGLRVVTVQAVGLAVVAALIGAGGYGDFVFQGLGQYALDLVLLGALPATALALAADAVLTLAADMVRARTA